MAELMGSEHCLSANCARMQSIAAGDVQAWGHQWDHRPSVGLPITDSPACQLPSGAELRNPRPPFPERDRDKHYHGSHIPESHGETESQKCCLVMEVSQNRSSIMYGGVYTYRGQRAVVCQAPLPPCRDSLLFACLKQAPPPLCAAMVP